jgi:prevent-host-death family protein
MESRMELTISASEFKAKCLDILKRLGEHRLARVTVTRRGKPVAVMTPLDIDEASARAVFGSMAGSVRIAPGVDLTEPVFEGEIEAEKGILYR